MVKKQRISHNYFVKIIILWLILSIGPAFSAEKTVEIDSTVQKISFEFTKILNDVLTDLDVYAVFAGINPSPEPKHEYKYALFKEGLMRLDLISYLDEALVVTLLSFEQSPVNPDSTITAGEENHYFSTEMRPLSGLLNGTGDNAFSNSGKTTYETYFDILVQLVDTDNIAVIDSFEISSVGIGASPEQSKRVALKNFKKAARNMVKQFYYLYSEIVSADSNRIHCALGKDFGIYKGQYFEIVEPDRYGECRGRSIFLPGKQIGLASVTKVNDEEHQSEILRLWQPLSPGCLCIEHPYALFGLQTTFLPPVSDSYMNFGIQVLLNPLKTHSAGFGLAYVRVRDSHAKMNSGFGLNGFGIWRFLNKKSYKIGFRYGMDLDIPFRKDDLDNTVSAFLIALQTGFSTEFMISPHSDLVLFTGYRFSSKSNKWDYTEEEDSIPATWNDEAPQVGKSLFVISVGYKFLLF